MLELAKAIRAQLAWLAPPALALALTAALFSFGPRGAAVAAGQSFDADQKMQIESIVRDYLLKNPEVLIEVQKALDEKMEASRQEAMGKALKANAQDIFHNVSTPLAGDGKGDVTVVEFFDYNCGYCRRALDHVTRLIDSDAKVKFVFKDFPIFGKDSEGAARVAIAAKNQSKYFDLHKAMLSHKGDNNEAAALELAASLGLDMDRLRKDMADPQVQKVLDENKALAEKLGIQGTPYFIIGEKVIPGAPEDLYDEMSKSVADVRKNGCNIC